jgi:hypothetical protein
MVHIRELHTCLTQTISDSLRRKSCPMLDAAEALFLSGRDQLAVAHKCSRGIGVEGIKTEDDQAVIRSLGLIAREVLS